VVYDAHKVSKESSVDEAPKTWREGSVAGGCFGDEVFKNGFYTRTPGRLTWNLQITHFERKIIFQSSMVMFHVNLQGV